MNIAVPVEVHPGMKTLPDTIVVISLDEFIAYLCPWNIFQNVDYLLLLAERQGIRIPVAETISPDMPN